MHLFFNWLGVITANIVDFRSGFMSLEDAECMELAFDPVRETADRNDFIVVGIS